MLQTSLIDMEWNTKWEWENLDIFSSKEISSPKKLQSPEDIDGSFNISEYRNSSAKSSISESSLKDVMKGGSSSSFPSLETSVCSNSDQSVGLKLGKRTYFENNLPRNNTNTSSSSNVHVVKKVKLSSSQNTPIPRCRVEGCNLDLSSAKEYHRKHRVCESHSKSLEVVVGGLERRFCQQCSRFHGLLEFDGKKRSCRKRLSDHNARRRKPHEKSIQFNSRNRSSSFYDEREELIYVFGNQTKHGEHNGVNHSFGIQFQNDVSMPAIAFNRMTSSNGTLAGVFDQGSNAEGLDLRRALSLLSNDSRGSCEPNYNIALNQPMRTNGPTMAQDAVHSVHHGLPVSSPDFWRVDHQSIDLHTHFQESHIFKAPYGIHYGNPMDEILKPM